MGLAMSRYLLEIEPVASATPADVERLTLPAPAAIVGEPWPASSGPRGARATGSGAQPLSPVLATFSTK